MPQREKNLHKNAGGGGRQEKYSEEVKSVQYGKSHHLTLNAGVRERAQLKGLKAKPRVSGGQEMKEFP